MRQVLPEVDLRWRFDNPSLVLVEGEDWWFKVEGALCDSDIKWNNFAGRVSLVRKGEDVAGCELTHFTGNCGVKAISHLYLSPRLPKELRANVISIIESFAFHKLNCGLLIGSDTNKVGPTLKMLTTEGKDYVLSPPTWNPNYTWNSKHAIALFMKDLNKTTHADLWQNMVPL